MLIIVRDQVSFIPKPHSACGAKTASLPSRVVHAMVETSTATGAHAGSVGSFRLTEEFRAHTGWNETGGASTSPCNDAFKGLAPADAPETVGLAAYLDERAASPAGANMYIDWHR